jgi:diguanylate cyclase (GGDEF)-like protein
MPSWHFSKPRIPARAVILSIAALAVPFAASQWAVEASATPLVWLVALIPAFLLAYYRGWGGVATALAAAMAALAVSNVALILRGAIIDELYVLGVITIFIAICLAIGWLSEAMHDGRARAELVALTDELTTLPNRRRVRMFLESQLSAPRRSSLSVALFDLDNFKSYNDKQGHQAGDVMLRTFAEVLSAAVPRGSMPARYGGEEFLAVLIDCDEATAVAFAERVRNGLRAAQSANGPVTVSAGVASGGIGVATINDLIVAADRALYRAKQDGRDRVCCASGMVVSFTQAQ